MKKHLLLFVVLVWAATIVSAQKQTRKQTVLQGKSSATAQVHYQSLDSDDPIVFDGQRLIYGGDTMALGPKMFFIDGALSPAEAAKYPYVYTSMQEAVEHLTPGTAAEPMTLCFAPWVYWIDDPDDPEVRRPKSGGTPFGMTIHCPGLRLVGLTRDPEKVILASNRGQTMGAVGNFTMFYFSGDDISCENLTFGNYCNLDLVYPLRPELGRPKRGSAIVQAQLVICNSDRVLCRNVHFISRLNMCNFVGAKRAFFLDCHLESTDDAFCGTGVYKDCTLALYAPRPFGHTSHTGAVFLDCDITSMSRGTQYFVKSRGTVAAVDTRLHGEAVKALGWRDFPQREERYYHSGILFDGKPYSPGGNSPETSIDLTDKPLLDAYRVVVEGDTIYNLYNLLRGDDDWNPYHVKAEILAAETTLQRSLSDIPTTMWITPSRREIETGQAGIVLTASTARHGSKAVAANGLTWTLSPEDSTYVRITPSADGGSCLVESIHDRNEVREAAVIATSPTGLCKAAIVYARPRTLPAPTFTETPRISYKGGSLHLSYTLDTDLDDLSSVTWYRCSDAQGNNAIPTAVSTGNRPLLTYQLTAGDEGYYIMATVTPRHVRCLPGTEHRIVFDRRIDNRKIKSDPRVLTTDFSILPPMQQLRLLPGFWSLDGYKPADTYDFDWNVDNLRNHWYYGRGVNGARHENGFIQSRVGARLRYTPTAEQQGDMRLELIASPAKTAGQGFASARQQYLDICIKFDHTTLTGYALRLIRTTKYGNAIDFLLVRYEHGVVTPISEPVSASCFRTPCRITLETTGNRLRATASTTASYYIQPDTPEVQRSVDIEAEITPNDFGGFGFQHTGTVDGGATQLNHLHVEWK